MKKVLLAFDGTAFSEGTFNFVRQLNERQPILAVAVFVPQVSFASLWSYGAAAGGPDFIPLLEQSEADQVQANIHRFETLCAQNGIRYSVHKHFYDFALPELKEESRFADLLVVSSEKFYQQSGTDEASGFLRDVVHAAECPVVVVPEHFVFPGKNILAYDGSASSVYAIKQFAYLFPELLANKSLLVYLKEDTDATIPAHSQISELAGAHFPNLEQIGLHMAPRKEFGQWVAANEDALLVCGAYGRSLVSQLFRKSFVSDIIAVHKLPVFIAHR
jgi:nucleotide-binding universal stress UspA family protein